MSWKVREWAYIRPSKKVWGLCIYTDAPDLESRIIAHVKSNEWTGREARSEAYLIAAAPDLLDACRRLVDAAPQLWGEDRGQWPRIMDRIEAAIAKAEGEKQ